MTYFCLYSLFNIFIALLFGQIANIKLDILLKKGTNMKYRPYQFTYFKITIS